jgi:hypothetical protein
MTSRATLIRLLLLAVAVTMAAVVTLAVPPPLVATSVVLGSDADLADQAPVIVDGTVLAQEPAPLTPGAPVTDYRVRVERVLKGRILSRVAGTGSTLRLRVLGGPGPGGLTLKVWGAPVLRAGERVLLFLVAPAAGSLVADEVYRPLHLAVGVFHQLVAAAPGGPALAVRDLSEMSLVDGGGGSAPGTVELRDYSRFARWLADRAGGEVRAPDYQLQLPVSALRQAREKFTYLKNLKQRWFAFDHGTPVSWTMSKAGQPGLDDGGFGEFQVAIDAWNTNQGTNIKYRYDGTSNFNGGFSHPDGHNTLLTEDPNDNLPGSFSCTAPGVGSGILAAGGTWYSPNAPPPVPIQEADIVTQDGVGCWFNHDPARAQQVMAHELGHSLGLGHSCGDGFSGPCDTSLKDQALMRTTAHSDDRGAALNDDDRAGIATLYGIGGGTGGPPAAPSRLTAAALSSSAVALAWQDNSQNASQIDIESKPAGGGYRQVQTLSGGAASTTVTGLAAGIAYSFRARAHNGSGFSGYSNEASATTQAGSVPAAPSKLTAATAAGGQVALAWQLDSRDDAAVLVYESSPLGDFARIASLPAGATSYLVSGLTPATPYTFRVRAQNASGLSPSSNLASATAIDGGPVAPCAAAADALCLLGRRFQVKAQWRDAGTGAHGSGRTILDSDQTGMFWFFDPSNVELIVKVLDGRPLNDFFWTFYGGLSDVEYWVTVTDTRTGHAQTYFNPSGNLCGGADVTSLPAGDRAGAAAASDAARRPAGRALQTPVTAQTPQASVGCGGGPPGALCLLGARFRVEVSWTNPQNGASGSGAAVPLTDQTGLFWFFDAADVELVVKILDGRPLNGKFWFFYGALSNVQYDVRVTDTTDGATNTYHNAAGNLCGMGDTSAF